MRRALPFLGRLPDFRRDPVGFLARMSAEQGDVARFRLGPQNVVLLRHPDDIRDVLVTYNQRFVKSRMLQRTRVLLGDGLLTSEEPYHTRQRKLVQPAFYRDRLVRYAATMAEKARDAGVRWSDGQSVDLDQEMMRLTLSIVTATLFSANVEAETAEIGAAMSSILNMFNLLMLPMSEWLIRIPMLPSARRFREARGRLDSVIYRIIREHRQAHADQGDLLSMLMDARDEAGKGMSDQELRDEALTLFIAGHETTAMALNWTWYLLAQNPDVERRFHEELDTVLQGRLPGYDDFAKLPVTESIFAESMRLYPPAWGIGRRAIAAHTVRGVEYPAGTIFAVSPWVTHRSPTLWADPERFDPDRFRGESRAVQPKFAYFPFGGGPRVCIGERFAWLEGVLVLAAIGQRWRFELDPAQPVEPQPLLTLRPKHGIKVTIHRR
ncbi:cytochrome P450 [Paludibaculum fermentans]|uniref:Cytochrome P450 n=1 Tax=Paludibaculum fermentans TaxID=1473598 RepID=A0A7S7NKN0_PALFE|nr:cytochrome P450 [Paludibaculum fermentans]QOY85347.1 cytochrome P450 [Paludibaculum fermentans]